MRYAPISFKSVGFGKSLKILEYNHYFYEVTNIGLNDEYNS